MVISENRSGVYALYMSSGSAGNDYLQRAIVEFVNSDYAGGDPMRFRYGCFLSNLTEFTGAPPATSKHIMV